jgi:hypothetical protein
MFRGLTRLRRGQLAVVLVALCVSAAALGLSADDPDAAPESPFPLDERLFFDIRYLGIHCGTMTIESFSEESEEGVVHRIVLNARSSRFFDGIYKVRTRIESWFSPDRMSSIRYRNHGREKKRINDDRYEMDFERDEVIRNDNGEISIIPIANHRLHDPLAYLYRLRALAGEEGDSLSLVLMTSRGDLPTLADVVERRRIKTPFGTREALRVVPRPEDATLFRKRGHMEVWVGTDEARLPYRVVFDLSFGKLVARLEERNDRPPGDEISAGGS